MCARSARANTSKEIVSTPPTFVVVWRPAVRGAYSSRMRGGATLLAIAIAAQENDRAAQLFFSASVAFNQRRHDDAVLHFERLRQHAPSFAKRHEADRIHGMALASLQRGEEALQCWERAMQAAPHDTFRRDLSSTVMRAAGAFHSIANQSPDDVSLRVSAGVLAKQAGNSELAVEHLEAALRLQPETPSAMLALGMLYRAERAEKAQRLLRTALDLAPRQHGCVSAYGALADISCGGVNAKLVDLPQCCANYIAMFEAALEEGDAASATQAVSSAARMALRLHDEEHGVAEAQALGERGVVAGLLHAPLQFPRHFIKGLVSQPWWHEPAREWRAVQLLEQHAKAIREEVMRVYERTGGFSELWDVQSDADASLARVGKWGQINIIRNGQPETRARELLPLTSKLVLSLPEATSMARGAAKVSVMDPGTLIRPHSGPTNSRIRIHCGISIPLSCGMAVNGEPPRTWVEGQCTAFDDSFVHSVWHNGTTPRIVLIVDVWHPDLDTASTREESLVGSPWEGSYRMDN